MMRTDAHRAAERILDDDFPEIPRETATRIVEHLVDAIAEIIQEAEGCGDCDGSW